MNWYCVVVMAVILVEAMRVSVYIRALDIV